MDGSLNHLIAIPAELGLQAANDQGYKGSFKLGMTSNWQLYPIYLCSTEVHTATVAVTYEYCDTV